jgi:hypothetical protein
MEYDFPEVMFHKFHVPSEEEELYAIVEDIRKKQSFAVSI